MQDIHTAQLDDFQARAGNSTGTPTLRSSRRGMPPFTPVFDVIADELGNPAANVFGVVWRFCQMREGACRAPVRTLGKRLHLDPATVHKYLMVLVHADYLEDSTPGVRNKPHTYRLGPRAPVVAEHASPDPPVGVANSVLDMPTNDAQSVGDVTMKRQDAVKSNQETEGERGSSPAAANASDSFELRLFRRVAGRDPPAVIFDDVVCAIQDIGRRLGRPPTVDDLQVFLKAWVGRGYNPRNLAWLIEWATSGVVPVKGRNNASQISTRTQPRCDIEELTPDRRAAVDRINASKRAG